MTEKTETRMHEKRKKKHELNQSVAEISQKVHLGV